MKFTVQDVTKLDPATLADELIAALGSSYEISTAGAEITTHSVVEPDPVAFQAVLDAHVLAASARAFKKQVDKYNAVVTKHIEAVAQRKGYDGGVSCASYAASTNATFKAEAAAFIAYRDSVWSHCKTLLAAVQAGTTPAPTEAELIAGLPVFAAW